MKFQLSGSLANWPVLPGSAQKVFRPSPRLRTTDSSPAINRWERLHWRRSPGSGTTENPSIFWQHHSAVRFADYESLTLIPAVNCWATLSRPPRGLDGRLFGQSRSTTHSDNVLTISLVIGK